jgi:uracil-DNA glycosylase
MKSAQQKLTLEPSWQTLLGAELEQTYMQRLLEFLAAEQKAGKNIYPASSDWFNAFNSTPFAECKVVILGQDPYHGPGQAHGLSFSVLQGQRIPPSLRNIFKELMQDLALPVPSEGSLQHWAEQGVLLLNATLTVEEGRAGAHQGQGWEQFTDMAIAKLNAQREGLVFMLWGAYAQKKGRFIDPQKHCILQAPHPSPLSAHRGFLGCGHFSAANAYLKEQGLAVVDWRLP